MRAVTFDLWHTLFRLAPEAEDRYVARQEELLAGVLEAARPVHPLGPRPFIGAKDAARQAIAAAASRTGTGSPVADLAKVAAELAGREPDPGTWVRAIEALVELQPFEQVEGARTQLARLADEGYRIGVVSNLVGETAPSIRRVMERLDMARFVESWSFSEELPWAKPAPEIFWRTLEPLGVAPADAVHFGDLGSDIHGARAAGFRSAVLFTGAKKYGARYASLCRAHDPILPPPSHSLLSWADLPALLARIWAQ
ncbi:MAG: HAD family hydrolase [Thermoplasmata archaeon]|nr:HAD family hydrolase [Thermoplasmata archaeon]